MKFALFLGCTIPARVTQYESASRAVLGELDINLIDIKEFNCCGYPLRNINLDAFVLLSARNLALAAQRDLDIITLCQCCFGSLKKVDRLLEEDASLRKDVNSHLAKEGLTYEGGVEVKHLLQVLHHDVGIKAIQERIEKTYEGLAIATHYGCHILRPSRVVQFDTPLSPTVFDQLVEITGARSVTWPMKLECCGAPLCGINDELSMDLTKKKIEDGRHQGAAYVCVACPYCHLQFDTVQEMMLAEKRMSDQLPSILYPQLLGICMGIDRRVLGLEMNRIPLSGLEDYVSARRKRPGAAAPLYRGEARGAMAHEERWRQQLEGIRLQDTELAANLSRLLEKAGPLQGEGNVYGERYSSRQIELSFGVIVETEAQRSSVLKALQEAPKSVKDLATELGLDPTIVIAHIVELRRRNHIVLCRIEERTPLYRALSQEDR